MNDQLQNFARAELKKGLSQCNESEQMLFKKMYSHDNLQRPIGEVVDLMPEENLDWAMRQVSSTLAIQKSQGG